MGLAVAGITRVIDDARKNTFVADALMFLDGAHQLVTSDNVNNFFGNSDSGGYAPSCSDKSGTSTIIPLAAINLDQGGVKSPWGKKYNKGESTSVGDKTGSYIQVTSLIEESGNCKFKYAIYLTDGVHSIGTATAAGGDDKSGPIPEENVNNSMVRMDS